MKYCFHTYFNTRKIKRNAKSISFSHGLLSELYKCFQETAVYRHNRKYLLAFIILRKLCAALVIGKGRKGNINGATLRTLIVPRYRATNARSIFTLITIALANERNVFNHRQSPSGLKLAHFREEHILAG